MKTRNILGSVAAIAIASVLLGACDDNSQSGSSGKSTNTTTSAASSTTVKNTPFVWPGKGDNTVAVSSNLTQANYMIVYDGSGSMADSSCGGSSSSKHDEGLVAVKEFVKAIPNNANVGLYVFDSNNRGVRVTLGAGNKGKVLNGLDNVRIGGGTPLGDALKTSYHELTLQGQKQLGYGRFSLVVVTDGAANDARYLTRVVNAVVDTSPVEVHAVGFCLGSGHALNQPGRTFYASAQSKADLLKSLKNVLAETATISADEFTK